MPQLKKWVCQTDRSHIFDAQSDDGFCPTCPFGDGVLFLETIDVPRENATPFIAADSSEVRPFKSDEPEVGLAVLLMDASSSMTDPAFEGNPMTRMQLVASTAASGIFDLDRMRNNPNAYVAAFKFDDRVEMMFVDTVANLIKKYDGEVRKFAAYIFEQLKEMQQGTDINKALKTAHIFVNKFLRKELDPEIFPLNEYTPMKQRILKSNIESVSIPNVRVLLYTDGEQYDTNGDKTLFPNPFQSDPLPDLNHDIVIGAFFGQESDNGCDGLKSLLSDCPIHSEKQFFLFDKPNQIGYLKYLFRMASGASGFCPYCLKKQIE